MSLISSSWQNVNVGDGGYSQIDPNNEDLWFVSNPPDAVSGVNIFSCASGINCHSDNFQNNQVVNSASVSGDTGPYHPTYVLDPQNPSELILGTCRMWRGSSAGGTFTAISHNFETGGDAICTGAEINLVRSLAVGGTPDSNGFSNVIYAGTDGLGPLVPTSPTGGRVWVNTNVAGGVSTWVDQTGPINPDSYPISGIAMDSSDTTGLTAYVSIMGFHTSHVWQTTNGGASWTDFTANLPDAPANAVLVDPGSLPTNGTLYVGTDVGVFSSSTAIPNWTEVGPAPSGGQAGYLPNVAVTALGMFNTVTTKLLRASTYGRGIWQFPLITTPDFVLSVSSNTATTFGTQAAVFNGLVFSLNEYCNRVNLTCANGTTPPPSSCAISPTSVIPLPSGAPVAVAASGADGDYVFNLHGVGTDLHTLTHDFLLTLHVVDFALTAPSPTSISVNQPDSSGPVNFQVTAAGSFHAAVNLSCSGLPDGAACNFSPSGSVNPLAGQPVNVILTVATSASTPAGTYPITIVGTTPGGPERTQSLSLTVTNFADYKLTISNSALSTSVSGLATFDGTLTAQNGYNSSVSLGCGAGAPPTCTANPTSLTPDAGGAAFTVTAKSIVAQEYSFNIVGVGTDPSKVTHSAAVTFTTTFDFSIANTSSPQSIAAGQVATYDLDVSPLGGNFPSVVTLRCSGLPTLSTCAFSPAQVGAGSGDTPVTFTIQTTAPVLGRLRPVGDGRLAVYALCLPGLMVVWPRQRRSVPPLLRALVPVVLLLILLSCGGGGGGNGGSGQPGTNPGTYTVTVTAVAGPITRTVPVTLTVN